MCSVNCPLSAVSFHNTLTSEVKEKIRVFEGGFLCIT